MKQTYFHGTSIGGLTLLRPHMDIRTGIRAVFVCDDPFGAEMFALLSDRSQSEVLYAVQDGKLLQGKVKTNTPLNREGWIYEVKLAPEQLQIAVDNGGFYTLDEVMVEQATHLYREHVLSRGWDVAIDLAAT